MQAKLEINGMEFSTWLKEDGLRQSEILRVSRSVVTLDGTERRAGAVKTRLDASLVELRDGTWERLRSALESRPVQAAYTSGGSAAERTGRFHVSALTAGAKTVRGGHTYFNGISFTLEEM